METPCDLTGLPNVPREGDEIQMDGWWFIVEEAIIRPKGDDNFRGPFIYIGATANRLGSRS